MNIEEYNKTLSMNIDDRKLQALKKDLFEALSIARQTLITSFPFTGNLSMHLDLVPVRDMRVRTACTDGNTIYFDIDFGLNKLSNKERMFVLAHEVWHCVLLHLVRRGTRDLDLFNIATDMEVNNLLTEQQSFCSFSIPKNLLFPPPEVKGQSAEVIYEWLLNNKSYLKNLFKSNEKSSSAGKDTGKLEGQFDNHNFSNDSESENIDELSKKSKVKDSYGEVGFDSEFIPKMSKDYADKMREALTAEAQRYERTKGSLPAGIESILKNLKKPEVNWREELCKFVTSCHGDRKTWSPPRRSFLWNEMYGQSRRGEKLKVACMIDTSGSCWEDLNKFFGELVGLLKTFTNYELTVVQCDCEVQKVDKYDENNPFPVDDLSSIDIAGSGGSSFIPAQKYLREKGIENEVDCIIGFTDGYIDVEKYPPPKQILWLLTKDNCKDFCNYGKKIEFKN